MKNKYSYHSLQLIKPAFDSPLTDLIIDLDYLRKKKLRGSSVPPLFFQLKQIFHLLESLESARIEGNRTTLADLIDQKMGQSKEKGEELTEIANVERAIGFVDETVQNTSINRAFISELHKIVVSGLSPAREGDGTPGLYRKQQVTIAKAAHTPPESIVVEEYMDELFTFINAGDPFKYDLLKTALAHHRFAWIHPFSNGNGRTVRLLTYAMLVKQGFNVNVGRILNPTAIFCNDRQRYYDSLAEADSGNEQALIQWCEYVLSGLKTKIEKIDRLLNHEYLISKNLLPAVEFSLERKIITPIEEKVLRVAVEKQIFQASDLKTVFPQRIASDISRLLRGLKEKRMITPIKDGARKYHLHFFNSYLLRGVIEMLARNGFVPLKESISGGP